MATVGAMVRAAPELSAVVVPPHAHKLAIEPRPLHADLAGLFAFRPHDYVSVGALTLDAARDLVQGRTPGLYGPDGLRADALTLLAPHLDAGIILALPVERWPLMDGLPLEPAHREAWETACADPAHALWRVLYVKDTWSPDEPGLGMQAPADARAALQRAWAVHDRFVVRPLGATIYEAMHAGRADLAVRLTDAAAWAGADVATLVVAPVRRLIDVPPTAAALLRRHVFPRCGAITVAVRIDAHRAIMAVYTIADDAVTAAVPDAWEPDAYDVSLHYTASGAAPVFRAHARLVPTQIRLRIVVTADTVRRDTTPAEIADALASNCAMQAQYVVPRGRDALALLPPDILVPPLRLLVASVCAVVADNDAYMDIDPLRSGITDVSGTRTPVALMFYANAQWADGDMPVITSARPAQRVNASPLHSDATPLVWPVRPARPRHRQPASLADARHYVLPHGWPRTAPRPAWLALYTERVAAGMGRAERTALSVLDPDNVLRRHCITGIVIHWMVFRRARTTGLPELCVSEDQAFRFVHTPALAAVPEAHPSRHLSYGWDPEAA